MEVSKLQSGNIIKFTVPGNHSLRRPEGVKLFEVKAVDGDKVYGNPLPCINDDSGIRGSGMLLDGGSQPLPSFEIIG